jgi:Ni/Co efflux regulator RcnB
MNLKQTICAALVATLAASNFAFAQGRGNMDRNNNGVPDRAEQRNDRNNNGIPDRAERRNERGNSGFDRDRYGNHDNGRHLGWQNTRYDRYPDGGRRWNRGDRLPMEYRDRQYIVSDWRGHQLSAPPRGYQWVQNGSDYLLVALATGLIAQLLTR